MKYAPNVRIIRVMCSGRGDPTFALKAFALGADGVLIAGCHPGECHYLEQNYKAMRRFAMLKHTLRAMGLEEERFQLLWASAAEGTRFAENVTRMTEEIRKIGPLRWSENWIEKGVSIEGIESLEGEHKEAMEVPAR
jgi:F420-non-reducing hydrogenase iron-sulfur subunit